MKSDIQEQRTRWAIEHVFKQQDSHDVSKDDKLAMKRYEGDLQPCRKSSADVADAGMPALLKC